MNKEVFNIRYELVGLVDGHWVVRAYDSANKQIGIEVVTNSPESAMKLCMMLNGNGSAIGVELVERKAA